MHRLIPICGALALAFSAAAGQASAAPCKDAHGKFTKCATAAAPAKAAPCKDAKGKFVKCPAPAAKAAKTS